MKKYFRMPRIMTEQNNSADLKEDMLKRFVRNAIVEVPGLFDLMRSETGAILRVTIRDGFSNLYCLDLEEREPDFTTREFGQAFLTSEVEIEVVKPYEPKRRPKSKEEIMMELKILIMTYINDLWRDFAKLDKPMESTNSWKHIEKFIEDTFYSK